MASQNTPYDFSEYPDDHKLYDQTNKKVIGKFKDETNGIPIREFVGLRSKMYAFNLLEDKKEIDYKKLKGVKKTTVKQEVSFQDYF